ncbi:MAG: M43 family zinc metalloprotease, partial [Bacteroidota bacterium]|nr:M43 family zinc metalloprotease [Bacteroidota bacterium]
MKHLLLGLAACSLSLTSFAQEPAFSCGNAELRERLIASDPGFLQREAEYEAEIRDLIRNNSAVRDEHVVVTIPVVFHVLHLGGRENISDEQIFDQVAILNQDFRKLNADLSTAIQHFQDIAADTRIEFALPTLDPQGQCTNGIDRIHTVESLRGRDESKLRPWPRNRYLNIWVTDAIDSGAAGYAYKPGSVEGPGEIRDGIMILHEYTGSIGTGQVGRSRALTHEVGHYFNLDHLWGPTNEPGVACGDDAVEDTPRTKGHVGCLPNVYYDYTCSSTPVDATMDFSAVNTFSGTVDPTPLPEPIAAYQAGTNTADTIGVAIDLSAWNAVGVSTNSMVDGEFAFSGWDTTENLNSAKYYDFYFAPRTEMGMTAQQIKFKVRRSEDGPRSFAVRKDPYATNVSLTAAGNTSIEIQTNIAFFVNDV